MSELDAVIGALERCRRCLILPHVNIDGDDLGSMLALGRMLKQRGKEVVLYTPDRIPKIYGFLPGHEHIVHTPPGGYFDTAVVLECPNPERLPPEIILSALARKVVNMDHHPDNQHYGDVNWVDPEAAALGEMVYQLLEVMGIEPDADMALALYVSILTDTGGFQFANTTPRTHQVIAALVERMAIPVDEVARHVFRERDLAVLRLLGELMAKTQISADGKVAWTTLTREMLVQAGISLEETQHFAEELNQIRGAQVMLLLTELSDGRIKASLRSRSLPVNTVAARFGGGGHRLAAGCTQLGSLNDIRDRILTALHDALTSVSDV